MKNKIFLILSVIILTLLATGGIAWANEYTVRLAQERAIGDDPVMENGIITWNTEGKKATSGIYYRTTGWNIHKEFVANGNISKSGVKYGRTVMQQIGERPTTNGQVKTFFEVDKDDVDRALQLVSLEWKQGETVYLSAITEVRQGTQDNYKVLGTYDNLQDLKKAQPWSRPDDFDQYFNRKIKLDFQPVDIVEVHLINGNEVNRIDKGQKLPGDIHTTTISKTIDFNGISANLKGSYAEPFNQKGKKINQKGATTNERKDTVVPDDGMTIFIEYEMPFPITVEHVNIHTGEVLQSEIKTIEDLETLEFEAKKFEGLNYLHSVITKDGGNTWIGRSDKTKRTITRNKGDLIIDKNNKQTKSLDEPQSINTQRDPYSVNVLYSEENPNEVTVEVTTVNDEILFDLWETIHNIQEENQVDVSEIHYYDENGNLLLMTRKPKQ